MTAFDYTAATWTKNKPAHPKAGEMGTALLAYEKEKKNLLSRTSNDAIATYVDDHKSARAALEKVESTRAAIIDDLDNDKKKNTAALTFLKGGKHTDELDALGAKVIDYVDGQIGLWQTSLDDQWARNQRYVKDLTNIVRGIGTIKGKFERGGVDGKTLNAPLKEFKKHLDEIELDLQKHNDGAAGDGWPRWKVAIEKLDLSPANRLAQVKERGDVQQKMREKLLSLYSERNKLLIAADEIHRYEIGATEPPAKQDEESIQQRRNAPKPRLGPTKSPQKK